MASSATYYIDGSTFLEATSVFTDVALTNLAPDGFYRFGDWVREQVGGVLLPAMRCPSCGIPCGDNIVANGLRGIYYMRINVGSTDNDTGVIIIEFDPLSIPDGIQVEYNGVIYNELSSVVSGYLFGIAGEPTYVGAVSGMTGGCTKIEGTLFSSVPVYEYDGTAFQLTNQTEDVYPSIGSSAVTKQPPQKCTMVIPKPTSLPSELVVKVVAPCSGTAFNINVSCPSPPISMASSLPDLNNGLNICNSTIDQTYYRVAVGGDASAYGKYDWVFTDAACTQKLGAGWYHCVEGANKWFRMGADGVIIGLGTC